MTVRIACDHYPYTYTRCLCGKSGQQCPSFQARTCVIGAQGDEVIEEPGMLDNGNTICLSPDSEHVFVGCVLWSCLDSKSQVHLSSHCSLLILIPQIRS